MTVANYDRGLVAQGVRWGSALVLSLGTLVDQNGNAVDNTDSSATGGVVDAIAGTTLESTVACAWGGAAGWQLSVPSSVLSAHGVLGLATVGVHDLSGALLELSRSLLLVPAILPRLAHGRGTLFPAVLQNWTTADGTARTHANGSARISLLDRKQNLAVVGGLAGVAMTPDATSGWYYWIGADVFTAGFDYLLRIQGYDAAGTTLWDTWEFIVVEQAS